MLNHLFTHQTRTVSQQTLTTRLRASDTVLCLGLGTSQRTSALLSPLQPVFLGLYWVQPFPQKYSSNSRIIKFIYKNVCNPAVFRIFTE